MGGDDAASFTAIGEAVNRASRLEGAAAVGEIAVDAEVLQAVAAAFPEARAEPVELKGFDAPVAMARLRASPASAAALKPADETFAVRRVGRWAAVLAALGAPCAGFYLFSPLIVALGYGAVFQNATFLLIDGFLDDGPARIILASLSIAAALACVGLVVRVRLRRRRQGSPASRSERQQERKLLTLAAIALALVAWEHWVHVGLYAKSFWHMR